MNNDAIRQWLNGRRITDKVIDEFSLSFEDCLVIPVHDTDGAFLFNKFRRDPFIESPGPKYWYSKSGTVQLYAAHKALQHDTIVITEGELDCLVLWSLNIPAVTSTGGAMSFRENWGPLFENKTVYICLDNDLAGAQGTVRILKFIPHAKVVIIPDTARAKDVTDYVSHGKDFRALMDTAKAYQTYQDVRDDEQARRANMMNVLFHEEWMANHDKEYAATVPEKRTKYDGANDIERAKSVPISTLFKVVQNKILCPFHNDHTPSMHVFKDNRAFCFVCSKQADTIDLYRVLHNSTFREAVEALKNI